MAIGDMMAWGLEWMDEQLVDHASQAITYYQDGVEVANVVATHGSNPHSTDDLGGVLINDDEMDWLISTDTFPSGFTPKRGDWIETIVRGDTFKFEVMSSEGGPVARRSDTYGYRWRIHSKRIEVT